MRLINLARVPNEATVKAMLRALTPPFVWSFLRYTIAPSSFTEVHGSERRKDYYDTKYLETGEYHQHYADSSYFFLWCVLIDRIRPVEVRCLFDIGCGPGQVASFLRDRGLQKYVGLDFSHECIRMARSVCPSFQFVCVDALSSDLFDTLDYDVVVSTEFFEHVEQDLAILDRIRPGTRVYGSVPNFPDPSHVRHFNSEKDVYDRYSSRFADFRVDKFLFGSRGMAFFLFEGVRVR